MPEFRFRAAAALDLRRQQENAAATALAGAEARLSAARDLRDQADAHRRGAQDRQRETERTGIDAATLAWHRNWIVRLKTTVDQLTQDLDLHVDATRQAERAWRDARQRRLALERMRERALRRHQQQEQREELKVIDELARLRFAMPDAGAGRDET